MAKAGAPQKQAPNGLPRIWMGPLVAGVSFALAYGITQRLAAINLGDVIRLSPRFEQKETPGVTLKEMRQRYGEQPSELRSDLDPKQLEFWRKAQEQADAAAKAKAEAEANAEREAAAKSAPKPVTSTEESVQEPKPVVEAPQLKPAPKPKPQAQLPAPRPQESVPLLELPPLQ